jgi:5-methylcytosine-specific restriction endonuclease McrBC regulatory subunit McrC
VRQRLEARGVLAFGYDDLTIDTSANRLLACAVRLLLGSVQVEDEVRLRLRQRAAAFAAVTPVSPARALAAAATAPRHERTYAEALWLARLVLSGHLADDDGRAGDGGVGRRALTERLPLLFEGFVRGAARHYGDAGIAVESENFAWHAEASARGQALLPQMRIDACIRWPDGPVVAIECKAYREPLVAHHRGGVPKLRAGHLYQLMSYLAVLRRRERRRVLGLLVYARVDESIDEAYALEDASVRVVTLDLAAPWAALRPQLIDVVRWRGAPAMQPDGVPPRNCAPPSSLHLPAGVLERAD